MLHSSRITYIYSYLSIKQACKTHTITIIYAEIEAESLRYIFTQPTKQI